MDKIRMVKLAVAGGLIGFFALQIITAGQQSSDAIESAGQTLYESCLASNQIYQDLGVGEEKDCEAEAFGE